MPTRKKSRLSGPRRGPKSKAQLPVDPDDAEDDLKDMPELVPESSDGESDEEVTFAEKRMTTYAKLLWGDPEQIRAALLEEAEMNGATAEVEQHISDYRKEQLAKAAPDLAKQVRDDIALRISADKERLLRERDVHYFPLQQACAT